MQLLGQGSVGHCASLESCKGVKVRFVGNLEENEPPVLDVVVHTVTRVRLVRDRMTISQQRRLPHSWPCDIGKA